MPLHPVAQQILDEIKKANRPSFDQMTPVEARAVKTTMDLLYGPGPEMWRVTDHQIGSPGATFPIRVYEPSEKPKGYLVYYHGGGWVIGSVAGYDSFTRDLASNTGCTVVSVDYRLAPEHPFPAAFDDAMAALVWTNEQRARNGQPAAPLMVCGDSAGGNLAAVAALAARDIKLEIALQILIYPVTDTDFDTPSYRDLAQGHLLTRDSMIYFWDQYIPDPALRDDIRANPMRATDLAGLAPALILTGEYDPLRDEAERYGAKLAKAGIDCDIHRYEGMIHGFIALHRLADPAARAHRDIYARVARITGQQH